jgi:predicted metal-dependent phosphoesterase TrpH
MSKVDLHLHSCVSDGRYTPAEVVSKAAGLGLSFIALTDHDNVDGLTSALEAARNYPGLKVIPGVEISTVIMANRDTKRTIRLLNGNTIDEPGGEVHILGYFLDYTNRELLATLKTMRESREQRAEGMVTKLTDLGMPIEWKRVQEIAGDGSIGRPHIAQALLEKGYISTLREAFEKYIAFGGPAYVQREKLSPVEAVELLLRANGLPVLAHPLTNNIPETLIASLKNSGLVGIETYYGRYNPDEIKRLLNLADKYGLIATGGSDYHGLDDNAETMMGWPDVPLAAAERLMALADKQTVKPVSSQ